MVLWFQILCHSWLSYIVCCARFVRVPSSRPSRAVRWPWGGITWGPTPWCATAKGRHLLYLHQQNSVFPFYNRSISTIWFITATWFISSAKYQVSSSSCKNLELEVTTWNRGLNFKMKIINNFKSKKLLRIPINYLPKIQKLCFAA